MNEKIEQLYKQVLMWLDSYHLSSMEKDAIKERMNKCYLIGKEDARD